MKIRGNADWSLVNSRWFALGIVALFLGASLGTEWISFPAIHRICEISCFGLAVIGIVLFRRGQWSTRPTWRERREAWRVVSIASLVAVACCAVLAMFMGSWQAQQNFTLLNKSPSHWFLVKFPTVLAQQLVLQLFIIPSLQLGLRRTHWVTLVGASIFAGLHLPNPILVGLTWIAGYFWILLFQRYRQLAPLVASHFCLAIAAAGLGGEYILNMRVGVKCLELMPQRVRTDHDQIKILPHAVQGNVDSLVQQTNQLILRGYAEDRVRASAATAYCLVDASRQRIIRLSPVAATPAGNSDNQNSFEIHVPLDLIDSNAGWELYAANCNGWYSKLTHTGAIAALSSVPERQSVQIFPRTIDGRCESIIQEEHGVLFSGWAIETDKLLAPKRIGLRLGERDWIVPLEECLSRPDIARAVGEDQAEHCGFEAVVPKLEVAHLEQIAVFVVDESDIWHPLPMVPKLCERIASEWPRIQIEDHR